MENSTKKCLNTKKCATIKQRDRAKKSVKKERQSKFAQRVSSAREKRELKDLIKKPKS
jgi:hypothetical protein